MQKEKKMNVYDVASQWYNELLGIYLEEYEELSDPKIEKIDPKYDPNNLTFDTFDYAEQNGLDDEDKKLADIPSMPPLEGDEEELKKKQESIY